MVLNLVKDTLAWVESKHGTKKAGTVASALSVTGSIVQVGEKYRVFESLRIMLPEGSIRPLPAKWPSHATYSGFERGTGNSVLE